MLTRFVAVAAITAGLLAGGTALGQAEQRSAHDYEFVSIEGEALPMSRFAGQVVLLVNTASECGFTPQYENLQRVWERYRDRGFVVLGVPSNDFGGQEPGTEAEIKQFCEARFGIDFPMTEKQKVLGNEAHPLYRWIAESLGEAGEPRWNFHKYLIGPDGELLDAWPSAVAPDRPPVTEAIEAALLS